MCGAAGSPSVCFCSFNSWPTVNASEFLVAIVPTEYDRFAVIEVGYTLQKVVIDATRMGLRTCWIGSGADHKSVVQHLGSKFDPARDSIICVCAFGYPSWLVPLFIRIFSWKMRQRLSLTKLYFSDKTMQRPLEVSAGPCHQFEQVFE